MIDLINLNNGTLYTEYSDKLYQANQTETATISKTAEKSDDRNCLAHIQEDFFYTQDGKRNKDDVIEAIRTLAVENIDINSYIDIGERILDLPVEDFKDVLRELMTTSETKKLSKEDVLESIEEKISRLKEHPESMYAYVIEREGAFSINDLYKGSFSATQNNELVPLNEQELENILERNSIESNAQNKRTVEFLREIGAEITSENVIKVQNVKEMVDGLNIQEELNLAEEQFSRNQRVGENERLVDDKIIYTESSIKKIIDDLGKVSKETIKENLLYKDIVDIGSLRKMMDDNVKQLLEQHDLVEREEANENEQIDTDENEALKEDVEEAWQQIKEIRCKLTHEAAIKISQKMPLESTEISKVASALKAIEHEQIELEYRRQGVDVNEEIRDQVVKTLDARVYIQDHKDRVMAMEVIEKDQTIEQVHHALLAYEENGTEVEARFGESVKRVETQIPDTLNRLSIEASTENVEISKALITQGVELTAEHIDQARGINEMVSKVVTELTPRNVVSFVKEGVNPYKASISELNTLIENKEVSQVKESIAESIVGLDDEKLITDEQKKTLIGMYRLLDTVEKNKEEVVGYLYKNNLPLTMQHLEEAASYIRKQQNIDVKVDDDFGNLEKLIFTKENSRTILQKSTEQNEKLVQVVERLADEEMSTKVLGRQMNAYIKEYVKKELGKYEGEMSLPSSFREKVEEVKNLNPEVIKVMEKNNVPITINNLYWFKQLGESPKLYANLVAENKMLFKGLKGELETLKEDLDRIEKQARMEKEAAMREGNLEKYKKSKQLQELSQFNKVNDRAKGRYQIPFMLDGKMRVVDLYVDPDEENQTGNQAKPKNIKIKYETKQLGKVEVDIQLGKDKLNYQMKSEKVDYNQVLEKNKDRLHQLLQKIGYKVDETTYEVNQIRTTADTVNRIGNSKFEEVI